MSSSSAPLRRAVGTDDRTRSQPTREAPSNVTLSAIGLRLAVGAPADLSTADGDALLRLLSRERLAVVAWLRSGEAIRRAVAPETAAAWRALWASAVRRGAVCMDAFAEAAELLEGSGVAVAVLKGQPLSEMLYGDPAARCSDDVDCFVAAPDRERAAALLASNGWRATLGDCEGDQTFERAIGEVTARLEVHSSLVSPRLPHLHVGEPRTEIRPVGGRAIRVLAGPLVPAYLASHLATHTAPPLLWWLDLHLLWSGLPDESRAASTSAARGAGLHRYLEWGVAGADAVGRALAGDESALADLGVQATARVDRHELWRHVTLAPGPGAALRAVGAWVHPPWASRDGGVVTSAIRRALRHGRLLLPQRIPAGRAPASSGSRAGRDVPPVNGVAATVTAPKLLEAAREVIACGGELVLRLSGGSMNPTMQAGDRVLLGPLPARLRPGAVVLIDLRGRPVIHRVHRLLGRGGLTASVQTRGDACELPDAPVPRAAVVARVVASQRGESWTSHALTLRFGATALLRGLRGRLRVRLSRVRRGGSAPWPRGAAPLGAGLTDDSWT